MRGANPVVVGSSRTSLLASGTAKTASRPPGDDYNSPSSCPPASHSAVPRHGVGYIDSSSQVARCVSAAGSSRGIVCFV